MYQLPAPLCAICDAEVCERAGWTLVEFAFACLRGGARFLQIRAKHASSRRLLDITAAIVDRASAVGAMVVVNDRADIARMAGADGVHVGQDDLTPSGVRTIVGPDSVVGLSTHTSNQMAAAVSQPVSYLAIGPVFRTLTKATGYEAGGLQRVREAAAIARSARLPIVAIGGITLGTAPQVIAAGADGVAVIGDLLVTGDAEARIREYIIALGEPR